MKVFISSVRRGLEEERDALPGMIQALGHEPRRFEDYTAQSVPSRQACLDGVEDADAYLLLLGAHYGDPLSDTGKSPTEEEFIVAKRRGIPILAFRKHGVELEPAHDDFIRRIEAYTTGMFRSAFSNVTELLPQVARAIRELEREPTPLTFDALPAPLAAPWNAFERGGWRSIATILELIAIPVPAQVVTATALSSFPSRLARLGRDHAFFDESHALDTGVSSSWAHAATRPDRNVPTAGLGVTNEGAISAWREMPSDTLGVILDQADLAERISTMLLMVAELVPPSGAVALAVGLHGISAVSEGRISDLGRRTSASLAGFGRDKNALVEPRDTVPARAIATGAKEIGRELATRLILAFREGGY